MMLEIMLDRLDPGREAATPGASAELLPKTPPEDAMLPFTMDPRRRVFITWCTASLMLPRPERRRWSSRSDVWPPPLAPDVLDRLPEARGVGSSDQSTRSRSTSMVRRDRNTAGRVTFRDLSSPLGPPGFAAATTLLYLSLCVKQCISCQGRTHTHTHT